MFLKKLGFSERWGAGVFIPEILEGKWYGYFLEHHNKASASPSG